MILPFGHRCLEQLLQFLQLALSLLCCMAAARCACHHLLSLWLLAFCWS
jgi:hypothetical protein